MTAMRTDRSRADARPATRWMTVALVLAACVTAACSQAPARVASPAAPQGPIGQAHPRAAAPAQAAAGPAGTSAPAQSGAAPAAGEYRLGPGDVVKISVYNNPDLATESEVSQRGRISFPLVGEVAVGGLTRGEAERAVARALSKGGFVPNAYVNLLVAQYRSQQVSVMGEVNKPGKYPVSLNSTVTDLLAMAGGITAKGSNVITLIQKDAKGRTVQQEINVKKLLAGGDGYANLVVGYDDIIYVPPLPVFYIYGEVRQPGAYPLTPDMTVRQALSLGGGLTPRGTERGIEIDRKSEDGEVSTRRARLTDRVQPDDVLQIPESWF